MAEIVIPNCANSSKVALKLLKLRLKSNFRRKDSGKGLRSRIHIILILLFVLAIYRDSLFRQKRLRLFEIGFVTFWALYWTCFFLSSEEDFQKKKLITCIV